LHSNDKTLVTLTPASRWQVSEDLHALWKTHTTVWFGNSSHHFQWIPPDGQPSHIEVPSLLGLPAKMHAIYRGNKPRLGPVVAVLVSEYLGGERPFSAQTKLITELTERAHTRGVLVYVVTPHNTLAKDHLEGYSLVADRWVKQLLPYPNLVYNRYFGQQYTRRDSLIQQLSRRGAQLINSPLPNKWDCYLWLKTNRALASHLPETRLFKSINDITSLLSRHSELYLKPRAGFRGAGIARLSKSGHTYQLVSSSGKKQTLPTLDRLPSYIKTNAYIVQQGIRFWNYPRFYDLKVLVQNTGSRFEITGKVARQAQNGRVTTHLHQGGEALLISDYIKRLPPTWQDQVEADLDRVALQTAQVLAGRMNRLGEFSLDMGLDGNGKVWIIEVNGKPSRRSFRVAGDLKARGDGFEHLIDYILHDYINLSR